jgi:hypothetical protein
VKKVSIEKEAKTKTKTLEFLSSLKPTQANQAEKHRFFLMTKFLNYQNRVSGMILKNPVVCHLQVDSNLIPVRKEAF